MHPVVQSNHPRNTFVNRIATKIANFKNEIKKNRKIKKKNPSENRANVVRWIENQLAQWVWVKIGLHFGKNSQNANIRQTANIFAYKQDGVDCGVRLMSWTSDSRVFVANAVLCYQSEKIPAINGQKHTANNVLEKTGWRLGKGANAQASGW